MLKRLLIALAFVILALSNVFAASVLLQWNAASDNVGVAGYNIYRNGVKVGSSTTTSYTDTGLDPATTYTYTVTAFDVAGNESGQSIAVPVTTLVTVTNPEFIPLHKYYMSPTGNDSADGLGPATAWRTPNHNVVCGDVIIAAAGSYSGGLGGFGQVSNCPSTSDGIDGTGGIYFATVLCAGPDLNSCLLRAIGDGNWAVNVTSNNWAAEGFTICCNETNSASRGGMVANGALGTVHHVAFVNNVIYNVGIGLGGLDNGIDHDVPGATGFDYVAFIGNITQNAEQDTVCTAATALAGPASVNSNPGTHFLFYGGFSYNHPNNGCPSDVENFMFDTWDAHGVTNQSVMMNNVGWSSYRFGLQVFMQSFHDITGLHEYIYNNTLFNDVLINIQIGGDLNIQMDNQGTPIINIYRNIVLGTQPNNVCATNIGGANGPSTLANINVGATGSENITFAAASLAHLCYFNGATGGTNQNFFENPNFNNTTDLLANRSGAPNCTGFVNVTACMGWNANTQALTNPSTIYDLTPTSAHSAGKGYQKSSTTCVTSGDIFNLYPTWLKGIVYLHVVGNQIFENSDLVTKPCGL